MPAIKWFITVSCALLLILCLFISPAHAQDLPAEPDTSYRPPTIREIIVEGLETRPELLVKGMMRSKEKNIMSPLILEEDLKRLYASGHFDDVSYKVEPVPGTNEIIVRITVKENSLVDNVEFTGVNEFSIEDLKKNIIVQPNRPLADYNRKMDELSITDKYLAAGFYFVSVSSKTKFDPDKGFVLYYNVREGPKVFINEINFTGNTDKDASDLLDNTYSQPAGFWSFLSATPFIYNELQNDLKTIVQAYRASGWLDATTVIEDITFLESKEWANITIHITAGDRYELNSVTVKGNTIFTTEEIREKMHTAQATTYDQTVINDDVQIIRKMYGEQAYIDADIQAVPSYLMEPGKVDIVFAIKEGKKIILNKLNFAGNTKTKEKVMRREFTFAPGDPIKLDDYMKSYEKLAAKMYFDVSKLKFDIDDPVGSDPSKRDLTVQVSEIPTGKLNFGAAINSNNGIAGRLEVAQRNFDITRWPTSFSDFASGNVLSGAGQTAKISLAPGTKWNSYSIEFAEPYLFDNPLALKTSLYSFLRDRSYFTERRIGGQISLEKRLERGVNLGLAFKVENVNVFNTDPGDPPDILAVKGTHDLNTLTPYLNIDKRNSILLPSKGFKSTLSVELGGYFIGGDFDFIKAQLLHQHYFCLYTTRSEAKHILQAELRMGWAEPLGNDKDLPIYERFTAGGTNSLRGFNFRTISPKVNGDPVGGDAMMTLSLEYSYPLYRERFPGRTTDIIRGALFVDSGNVTEEVTDMNIDDFRASWGFGVRFIIPNLTEVPISMDVAFPISSKEDDDQERFHFFLGFFY
ncbi:MAG: outer membrane protein assembly factor BamA [Planctomycetes bacterium]|nr:outer membrane protein assembly factor BamA [Planctomycetota bacterium]